MKLFSCGPDIEEAEDAASGPEKASASAPVDAAEVDEKR